MKIPTIAVKHPADPSVRMLVNESDAHLYEPWEAPAAQQAPAAEGGDPVEPVDDAAPESTEAKRPRRQRRGR